MAATANAQVESFRRRWQRRSVRYGPPTLFPVIAAATAAVAGVNHGAVRVYWSLGAIGATAGTALFNAFKERQATVSTNAAVTAKSELAAALTRAGEPLITALGNVTAAKTLQERREALSVLMHLIVEVAASRCGLDAPVRGDIRGTYYALSEDKLERKCFAGRQGNKPRKHFASGHSPHADEVLRLVRSDEVLMVEDLENVPPPHFTDNKGRSYKSFIAVPVKAGGESYGFLSVDSNRAMSLTVIDRGYVILLAGLLAAGLAYQSESDMLEVVDNIPRQPSTNHTDQYQNGS